MEVWFDNFQENAQQTFTVAFGVLIAWAILQWCSKGYKYFTGILEEHNVSKRTLQTRKKKEADVISDGTTILLAELKAQGLLTPGGVKYWEGKFKSIGLVKPEEPNLLGKAWHYPVTHSMLALKELLSRKYKNGVAKTKEVKETVYND
jgi:hypothetical protein